MMSVNEFFYGNQATPTQIIKTGPTPVKQQHPPYGSQYTIFSHDSTLSRDDHSSLDSYGSRYQQESQFLNSRYPSSTYISSSAQQYDNSPQGVNHRRTNSLSSKDFSSDFSSPSYSRHSSRGSNSRPVSTWVELRVPICCEGCVERLTCHLLELRGVESVTCDQIKQKVVVRCTSSAGEVLRVCKKLFKRSEFWRYQYDWS